MPEIKFSLGRLLITRQAQDALHPEDVRFCVDRHAKGDWGELCEEDRRENELALTNNLRLFSAYHDRNQTKFWIITEADRSATTILLPEDY